MRSVDTDLGDDVTPQQIAAWRQETVRLQRLYDVALNRVNNAHRARTALLQKQAQLQADLNTVNGQIPGAQTAAQNAKNLVADLAARLEELRTARDAATGRLLGSMATRQPLVLFPVRLETRFVTKQAGIDFLIRVYPDDIHIDAHEPELTKEEELWGRQFWQNTTAAGSDTEAKKRAWRQLCDRFGVRRAAWIARVLTGLPSNVPRRAANWTRAPETTVLPDRWVAIGYNQQRPVFTAWGSPIADRLVTGLAPQATQIVTDGTLPPVNEEMRWMLDFEAAVAAGMGLRVSLTNDAARNGFDRVLVVGIKATLDDKASATRLATLFDAQHYTHELAFVPQNTPTNNTADASSGFVSGDIDADSAFPVERSNPLIQAADGSDGDVLRTALGTSADLFAHVQNADGTEQRYARAISTAMWPVLDGPFLKQLSAQVPAAFLRTHFIEHVRARGPFAALRVGNQPYGLLPVASLNRWRVTGESAEDTKLVSFLKTLKKLWTLYGISAPRVELGTEMPDLLREDANACLFFISRPTDSGSSLEDPVPLRRLPAAFDDKVLNAPPNPNYLRLLRQSNADTIRNESFPNWDAKHVPKPHPLPYLFLRQAALRLFDTHAPEQSAFQESLAALENLTIEALHSLMAETLGSSTHRLDAWITSLATKRLKALRTTVAAGVQLGGFGWLENVRPSTPLRQVTPPDGVSAGPLFVSDSNKGYVHTPSLGHAAAAAVLRSGFLSHNGQGEGEPLAIDLSSERVHRAKWVLDGVRQGQPLGALLGYRFERALHDNGLDRFIFDFRTLAGLKQEDELAQAYEKLNQAEALASEVSDLYAQSQEAAARADAARQLKQQAENQRNQLQAEVNAINALDQFARAADATVAQLDASIAQQQNRKPQSGVSQKPGRPNFSVEIVDERDLDAWADQLLALQGQRTEAGNQAKLAHNNFNGRVGIRDFDLTLINALNNATKPNSIPALDAEIARQQAAAQALDQQALSKEGTRGKAEADLTAARAALGQLLTQQWARALESVAANNVVDGLELQRRWKTGTRHQPPPARWDATTIPFGNAALGFPAVGSDDFKALDTQLRALDEMVDAVSDVVVAESVYHLVQGNPLRAGATLDAIATGEMAPPELDVVRTPRTGIGLTHRLLVLGSSSLNMTGLAGLWPVNNNQVRAKAEPFLNAWVAQLLGNPTKIRCRSEYRDTKTGAVLKSTKTVLATLRLSPLDVVFMAEGNGQAQRSELEQQLVFFLRRAGQPSGLNNADIRLIFDRDPSWAMDTISFAELVEIARTIRKMIAGARAADGRDLSLPEAPSATAIDLNELAARVDHAVRSLQQAQQTLTTLLTGASPPNLEFLRAAILRMTCFGVQGAVPLSATGDSPDILSTLLTQARSVAKEVDQRLARIAKLPGANAPTPEAQRDYHFARSREVFGPDFRILPRFTPENGTVLNQAFDDSLTLQDGDPFAAATFFQRLSRVRDRVAQLNATLVYSAALNEDAVFAFQVGQLPYQQNDRWIALPRPSNQTIDGGKLSLVAHFPLQSSIRLNEPLSGLWVDEWTEVVPSRSETTGLTFHYDQPGACAPQAVLIAVPSDDNRSVWDLDMLVSILNETFELAQLRALSLNGLIEASWVEDDLPTGATARGDGESWQWISVNPAPLFGKLAHQSASVAGMHQHFFDGAAEPLIAGPEEILFAYVLLDPAQLPAEVMLQWNDGTWEHRAYWGGNNIGWGSDGTNSRRFMGPLPPAGQWVRLEVPVELVGLTNRKINGIAFTLFNGRATWDRAGKGYRPGLTVDSDAIDVTRAIDPPPTGG